MKIGEQKIRLLIETSIAPSGDSAIYINDKECDENECDLLPMLERISKAEKIIHVGINIYREKELEKNIHLAGGFVCIDLQTSDETFKIDFFNDHNGYYPSEVQN